MPMVLLPEYAAAVMAEREADVRRTANIRAYQRLASYARPGVGAILGLLWAELLWELAGLTPRRKRARPYPNPLR